MKNQDDIKISTEDLNNKTVIYILLNATDEVSPFFQNFYSLKETEEDAISDVMKFTSLSGYKNVIIEEIKVINVDDLDNIKELIENENFCGFIQNIKEAYPDEE
jgi:hypothetical protein